MNSDNNSVSFVLPAYKGRFLKDAIASVLAQTHREFKLIVVDDCSPDDLEPIVRGFDDPRVEYHRSEKNIGGTDLVAAWNHAMSFATSTWCVLASDDDVYEPRYLEAMLGLMRKYPKADLFHCRLRRIDENGNEIFVSDERKAFESCEEMIVSSAVKRVSQVAANFMFRRSALLALSGGGFVNTPEAWYSDIATWIALSLNGVGYSSEILFNFRQSGENLSSAYRDLYKKQMAAVLFKKWIDAFVHQHIGGDEAHRQRLVRDVWLTADRLSRWEMLHNHGWVWFKNLVRSPFSLGLKFRFVISRIRADLKGIDVEGT